MRRDPVKEPPYSFRQRVELTLSAAELEHAIRCWLLTHDRLPQAKSFSDIAVRIFATDEGTAISVIMTYEPTAPQMPA